MQPKKYATVKEMANLYPFFSQAALRHLIYENRNGIHECILRVGAKILFDIEKFETWLDKHRMSKND